MKKNPLSRTELEAEIEDYGASIDVDQIREVIRGTAELKSPAERDKILSLLKAKRVLAAPAILAELKMCMKAVKEAADIRAQAAEKLETEKRAKELRAKHGEDIDILVYRKEGFDPTLARLWAAIHRQNQREPRLFSFGDHVARVVSSAAREKMKTETLSWLGVRNEIGRLVKFYSDGDEPLSEAPPDEVCQDILHEPDNGLPVLRGIEHMPFFAWHGHQIELVRAPGYDAQSGYYLDPHEGVTIPDVPLRPSKEDVLNALAAIDDCFGDFPFDDGQFGKSGQASFANFLAFLLSFFMRGIIAGHVPISFVVKPAPGTGASLLISNAIYLATGKPGATETDLAGDKDEWRKTLFAASLAGKTYFWLDNVGHKLDSAAVANFVTMDVATGRILGKSEHVEAKIRMIWVFAGNNVGVSEELARRCSPIRLDAKVERPNHRAKSNFKYPGEKLREHIAENHGRLVASCLVLIQNWVAGGAKDWTDTSMTSFEEWSKKIGGVLAAAGVGGFLANLGLMDQVAEDSGAGDWKTLFAAWLKKDGVSTKRKMNSTDHRHANLVELIQDGGLDIGLPFDSEKRDRWLGAKLATFRDRVFDIGERHVVLKSERDTSTNSNTWFWEEAKTGEGADHMLVREQRRLLPNPFLTASLDMMGGEDEDWHPERGQV
jgi:putative DNA primase/helicase